MSYESWAEDHGYHHIRCRRCGWSGMTDTDACDNGCDSPEEKEEEEDSEIRETLYRSTVQIARKAYPGINPGDTYRRTVTGGYTKGGPRWLTVRRTLVKMQVQPSQVEEIPF